MGNPVVLVFSRWGKVAAATTVTILITKYAVEQIIFTGVAGSVDGKLKAGDIVIGKDMYQHDMDARPLFRQFEIPLLNVSELKCEETLVMKAKEGALKFLNDLNTSISKDVLGEFKITKPKVMEGLIASGDKFFNSKKDVDNLKKCLPEALCVEMEGGAVAQVCHEYEIPFVVIRTISDSSDENSHLDFEKFIDMVASNYSYAILKNILT